MSLKVNNRIAAKEGKSWIPEGPEGIRENLSIEAYSARDGSRYDQGSLVRGKARCEAAASSEIAQPKCGSVCTVGLNR